MARVDGISQLHLGRLCHESVVQPTVENSLGYIETSGMRQASGLIFASMT